jgi:hypothetical protein
MLVKMKLKMMDSKKMTGEKIKILSPMHLSSLKVSLARKLLALPRYSRNFKVAIALSNHQSLDLKSPPMALMLWVQNDRQGGSYFETIAYKEVNKLELERHIRAIS